MTHLRFLAVARIVVGLALCAFMPQRDLAQGNNDPLSNVPKLPNVLGSDGFEALPGRFRILDPVITGKPPVNGPGGRRVPAPTGLRQNTTWQICQQGEL